MNTVDQIGGARIGRANASWPFASLKVTHLKLTLNVTIVGKLIFQPSDVKSIEVYGSIPFLGQGIKINHNVNSYKDHVVFWTTKNPQKLIEEIEKTGFLNPNSKTDSLISEEIRSTQKTGGFPLKTSFAISIVVLWNVLFLIDAPALIQNGQFLFGLGKGAILSTGAILIISIILLISPSFQKIALKNGREIKDISKFIYFLIFIAGTLFLSAVLTDL